ncbi:MAG: hypothetical protein U1B77_04525 [Dehalococcoidales bacterium]|nr:hypothetical protein [Dehalococcoidales bacterium]
MANSELGKVLKETVDSAENAFDAFKVVIDKLKKLAEQFDKKDFK